MKASLIGLIMGILALAAIAPASLDAQTSAPPAQAAPLYAAAFMNAGGRARPAVLVPRALPNRLPTIQRPQGTVFDGYGRGPDIRAQSERGYANQQMIVPRGPSPSYSAPRSSGGVSRGGTPSSGGMLRR
jgi:hypothetical protein